MEASPRKRGSKNSETSRDDRIEDLRRDLDALTDRVDRVLAQDDWVQAKLYDLNVSLAALAHPEAGVPTTDPSYALCIRKVRETVRRLLPRDAKVVVVSRGDEALLDLFGREAWHFPQEADGGYLGYYPPDGPSVIAQLETLRLRGAQFLLFPATAMWWLDEYPEFSGHLQRHYPVIRRDSEACIIFALEETCPAAQAGSWKHRLQELIEGYTNEAGTEPSILDWDTGLQLRESFPDQIVFPPPETGPALPYLDGSVDIVLVASSGKAVLREARRVAGYAVMAVKPLADSGAAQSIDEEALEVEVELIDRGAAGKGLPSCSIVIPTHDGIEHLQLCFASLQETLPQPFEGEVIVVDDGSGEEMRAMLEDAQAELPFLKVIRNAQNKGFINSCNRGASAAKGDILIFLNDDTIPQEGWLEALLRTFREHPDAGAAGGKLIYPDGRLQEAGNLVFSDGSAANFGRDDRVIDSPLYNYLREVDYCSGALLATPRSLFREIGGFDKRYEPGYYEDTDYCFEVRARGQRVYYQPESLVVHTEGGTGGTDLTAGAKKYQVVNQGKFAKKWKDTLRAQPKRPTQLDAGALYGLAARAAVG
jgi:GT2 family glycosyltransferase